MITDFPEAKRELAKAVNAFLRQRFKEKTPMLSMGTKRTFHEGDKTGMVRADGRHTVSDLQYSESGFSVPIKDVPTMKPEDLLNKVTGVAEDLAGQVERRLLMKLEEAIEESGNTIPYHSELSHEFILAGLEVITVNFEDDDRTKPVKPTILAGPDTIQKLMEQASRATPEEKEAYRKREEAIFDKKYDEHLKDLASRKLVD